MSDGVLIVAHQYWPEPGAASQRLGALAAALLADGVPVTVITSSRPLHDDERIVGPHGEQIYFAKSSDGSGTSLKRAWRLWAFAREIRRIGRRVKCSVVVTDPPPTAAWAARSIAKRHSASYIYYLCDSWSGLTKDSSSVFARIAHPFVHAIERNLLKSADLVVAATNRMRTVAVEAKSQNVLLALNGTDLSAYRADGPEWKPAQELRQPYFIYAGNAGVVHGATIFAEAAMNLWNEGHDFGIVYMGAGGDFTALREVQQKWADRITLIEPQPAPTVAAAFRGAVGALSSLRPFPSYADARPTKTLASLAAGCPAVYAGAGDFADELRANGLGYISDWSVEGAVSSLRAALETRTGSPEAERKLRHSCAAYASAHFDQLTSARAVADRVVVLGHG